MTETQGFRPLIAPASKFQPLKQIFNGYEIEKKFVMLTQEEDHTKQKNGMILYNEVLEKGIPIEQGYIKDLSIAIEVLEKLEIQVSDFKPNTIRFRKYGKAYILTLKDRKEVKKREVEFKLSKKQFLEFWPLTNGARITKKRLVKKVKGWTFEIDAFTDRFLLLAECEVTIESDLAKVPKLGLDVTNDNRWANKNLSK